MIIGDYVVNPLEVVYGCRKWNPNIPFYEVTIQVVTSAGILPLTQMTTNEKTSSEWMRSIEKCIAERKEAILDGSIDSDDFDEDFVQ